MMLAGLAYFTGLFICTAIFNEPLNNRLDSLEPDSENLNEVCSHYFQSGTSWIHLRAVSELVTCEVYTWLLSSNYC